MTQVHTDPERLREFAGKLEKFADDVDHHLNRLAAALSYLGHTWQDDEYKDFHEEFSVTQSSVKTFVTEIKKITPELRRDAEKLDPYFR